MAGGLTPHCPESRQRVAGGCLARHVWPESCGGSAGPGPGAEEATDRQTGFAVGRERLEDMEIVRETVEVVEKLTNPDILPLMGISIFSPFNL